MIRQTRRFQIQLLPSFLAALQVCWSGASRVRVRRLRCAQLSANNHTYITEAVALSSRMQSQVHLLNPGLWRLVATDQQP